MIWGIGEKFCTPGGAQGGAQEGTQGNFMDTYQVVLRDHSSVLRGFKISVFK